MKKNLFFLMILCFVVKTGTAQSKTEVYIRDFSPKIKGKLHLEFIFENESQIGKNIYFDIYYKNNKVVKVIKQNNNSSFWGKKGIDYVVTEFGDISLVKDREHQFFLSRNFEINTTRKNIYILLFPNFFDLNNEERIKLLENLLLK